MNANQDYAQTTQQWQVYDYGTHKKLGTLSKTNNLNSNVLACYQCKSSSVIAAINQLPYVKKALKIKS